ncbi:hypothetical protein [Halobacillus karajensis]|uniref:hypothetical protein n=1 Tax=Halobacillus karajensis TaxID=195088 RepID=UPI00045CAC08|nr:hypothetical protein [Halobacillus karajensis]CDQ21681.1 hypothetical protein BN982_04090 [Halobacillus karajensis]
MKFEEHNGRQVALINETTSAIKEPSGGLTINQYNKLKDEVKVIYVDKEDIVELADLLKGDAE